MKISKELLRNYLTTRRSFMLLAGKLSMLSLLSLRMLYIQIIDGSKYKTLSDKNRINVIMLPPHRGKIRDADGKIIADNKNIFNLKNIKFIKKNYFWHNSIYSSATLVVIKGNCDFNYKKSYTITSETN